MTFTPEQINKAKVAKSAEELLEMAAAEGVAMTADEAAKYFAELHKEGELTENELAAVAGGKGDDEEPAAPTEYFYPEFEGAETMFTWRPICPNDLGLYWCHDCEGNIDLKHCNGHHKRKEHPEE